jgi:hypothetical protein
MTTFKDYSEIVEPLVLPIHGKSYTIPPIGIKDGLAFDAILKADDESSMSDEEFRRVFLGAALDEMRADNVPGPAVTRAAMTALADYQRGRDVAEVMWETGGDPRALAEREKAQTPNRAARRTPPKTAPKAAPSK